MEYKEFVIPAEFNDAVFYDLVDKGYVEIEEIELKPIKEFPLRENEAELAKFVFD